MNGVAAARALRKRMPPQEAKLWLALRELRPQGLHFRRQAPFQAYVLDFACFARRLALEVDGGQHSEPGHAAADARRDAVLAREGFMTVRVQNHEVDSDLAAVVEAVVRIALERPDARAGRSRR